MTRPTGKPAPAFDQPLDQLYADIAIRIQLSATAHGKAVQRYETIADGLERDDSPFKGLIELFYPQGSMAIGAAIASGVTDDDFDLDMVLQARCGWWTPKEVLDRLFEAINRKPGPRYYRRARRRSRCVTIEYSGMHIDVTPAERLLGTPERQSNIFHHKAPEVPGQRIVANPFGFAEWFNGKVPDTGFAEQYAIRARAYEESILVEAADAEPVPQPEPATLKSLAVVVLQLLKRWRNVQYRHRGGRKPPSIVMSKLVADAAGQTATLSEEMFHQAVSMLEFFERSHNAGQCVKVVNPACPADVLTDRWPGTIEQQAVFLNDLRRLVDRLEQLDDCNLNEMKQIMVELFGEGPTAKSFEECFDSVGHPIKRGQSRYRRSDGRIVLPGAAATGISTPKHKFYGGKWK